MNPEELSKASKEDEKITVIHVKYSEKSKFIMNPEELSKEV